MQSQRNNKNLCNVQSDPVDTTVKAGVLHTRHPYPAPKVEQDPPLPPAKVPKKTEETG